MEIYYDDRQTDYEIGGEATVLIERVIRATLESEELSFEVDDAEISISFVDGEEIRELNRDYRGVDSETDVLSFPLNESQFLTPMLGDIVINTNRVDEQSKEFGHSFERELAYLTCHSCLHLLGYDHMVDEEKEEMRSREKEIMKSLSIFKGE